jgi:mono/diheme cytochrome c family protein
MVLALFLTGDIAEPCGAAADHSDAPATAERDGDRPSRILDRIDAARLTNPIAVSPDVLKQGRALFETYCAVCHGANGAGEGPVSQYFSGIPNLSAPAIQGYSDGLIYSIIREGGFSMPGYAETLSVSERWAVVHAVRAFRQPS